MIVKAHLWYNLRRLWLCLITALSLTLLTGCFGSVKPVKSYSWNQKMTLTVTTAEGTYTSHAIQEMAYVYYKCRGLSRMAQDCGQGGGYMRGEGPFVELPDGSVVAATLDFHSLIFDVSRKQDGWEKVYGRYLQHLIDTPGYALSYDAPLIERTSYRFSTIWVFPDPSDDTTRKVLLSKDHPRDPEPILSATLKIETTTEPRTPYRIEQVLTFLQMERPDDKARTYIDGRFSLSRSRIIGDVPWPDGYEHELSKPH